MSFGKLCAVVLCVAAVIASDPAAARGRGGGGRSGGHHGSHHHHHSHSSFVFAGAAFLPAWYYYDYPPVYAGTLPPLQYIERDQGPQEEDAWLYCPVAGAYFPSVVDCPSGWQRVPAKPPGTP